MTTFTWIPDVDATADKEPTINAVAMGDGYEQRQQQGLNPIKQIWNLTFSVREYAEADAIEAFFISAGAVIAFDWTPPRQVTSLKFVCKKWQRRIGKGNLDTVTATFTQVFES